MTLISQAKEIVIKQYFDVGYDEIVELSRIKTLMAIDFAEFIALSARNKNGYIIYYRNIYVEIMNQKREATGKLYTSTDAKAISEAKATEEYGDYRIYEADAKGMEAMIDSIKDYCINRFKYHKPIT